ncbi:MAG: response regulator, partial [Chthoniobacteraceae bacterium]
MNQCLEKPPRDGGDSAPDAPGSGDGVNGPLAAAGAVVSGKGRVLLLEDDPALNDIIRDCLVENGYTVVAVKDGGEGVREVLANDFMMVFCDFMMPGLPGDMFYRAVEKIRPALCHGFIFMTGHQGDAKTKEFIESVNGFVLRKPFPLKDLLDSIALAEVRRTYQSVCDGPASAPDESPRSRPAANFQTGGTPFPQAMAVARILARAQPEPAPRRLGLG